MRHTEGQDSNDGIIHISQSGLIALQREARLLRSPKGQIRSQHNGGYVSSFRGRGMEFDEARLYQPGDDVRNIDWRVTARTNKPHSKVFREERERPVLLWVDFRAPMFFGTRQYFKSVMAAKVAAILAWKSCHQGDRLGGLIFSEQGHLEIRPGRGKSAVLQLIQHLSEYSYQQHKDSAALKDRQQASEHALKRLLHVAHPGSLIYLISDFRHVSSQLESTLSRLGRHNELELIHLHDPLEAQLPQAGLYRVTDGRDETEINSADASVRERYQQRFSQHQQNLKNLCLKIAVRYLPLSTEQPLLSGLMSTPLASSDQVQQ
ncbi:MAG: DUF58 domain-containing protein [Gammaproteobacteria bacterium]|nr:DUF58 domain-containing protein [Gammaproteobacteria bacterium]MBL6998825.1 DUF58 domain-containing protein [Gammaproteobacteria bacterium]